MTSSLPTPAQTLYLIDGHAQIFRAYYAIRNGMTSPVTGEPTNATFAFTGMMLKFLDKLAPHYAIMAIDTPGKTFRDELYPDYKAQRKAPPDDFAPQIPRIFEITKLLGIPIIGLEGVEADDIIATAVDRVLSDDKLKHINIRIVSKDKDLEQLLGRRVSMFDIHTDKTIDPASLLESKGITPGQVIDMLMLTGDSADNIPGVEGIGPKTAAKLIQDFGSIDGILENIDKIKGKRKENIQKARELLSLSRQLVSLKRDVDIDFDMDQATLGRIDAATLRSIFKQLGFNRHIADLDRLTQNTNKIDSQAEGTLFATSLFDVAAAPGNPIEEPTQLTSADDADYKAVINPTQLDELVTTLKTQTLISIDTETIGLGARVELAGISLAWQTGSGVYSGVYIPMRSAESQTHMSPQTVLDALRPLLEDATLPKCGHNLKYDLLVLRHAGVNLRGIVFDSMIGAYLLEQPGLGLDHLALSLLHHEMTPITDLIGPRKSSAGRKIPQKTIDQVPLAQVTPYAAEDADMALRLCNQLRPRLGELGMSELADKLEMPLVSVLADMEHSGIEVDPLELDRQRQRLQLRIDELRHQIHDATGEQFNVDSPKQLAGILFTKLGLPIVKRTKTGPSTDSEVLDKLCEMENLDDDARLIPQLVLEYRQLTKLVGTYLVALQGAIDQKTGRIHASFHQTGTATGRLSSSGPNLQNIPIRTDVGRQIRKAFIAKQGHVLISADYSQIELRILGHLSNDANLLAAFAQDMDIHTAVAAQVFNVPAQEVTSQLRGQAKTINFGIIYGVTPYGLARRIEGLDVDGAKQLIAGYKQRFPGIDSFLAQCVDHAGEHGYVKTMLGRRRAIAQIHSSNGQTRALGERLAINTVVQGSAADLIKMAMLNLHRRIEREALDMAILLQIHDELVVEAPAAQAEELAEIVRREMCSAMELHVPLKVDVNIGRNWLTAK